MGTTQARDIKTSSTKARTTNRETNKNDTKSMAKTK